jgi:hypothetical protein
MFSPPRMFWRDFCVDLSVWEHFRLSSRKIRERYSTALQQIFAQIYLRIGIRHFEVSGVLGPVSQAQSDHHTNLQLHFRDSIAVG